MILRLATRASQAAIHSSSSCRTMSTTVRLSDMHNKIAAYTQTPSASLLPKGWAVSSTWAGVKAAIAPGGASVDPLAAPAPGTTAPKPDLALVVCTTPKPASAAGTFTRNAFKAAPVVYSSQVLTSGDGRVRAVLTNSGCANAVTGKQGMDDAAASASNVRSLLGTHEQAKAWEESEPQTLLLSTGVIGVPLPMPAISKALARIAAPEELHDKKEGQDKKWEKVARAFMTTDTFPKLRAKNFHLAGRDCRIVGIDKGAGMIHPSMGAPSSQLHATLLGLFATDAPISPPALQAALTHAVSRSFNCISVDGDMSTNDTILALANGAAPSVSASSLHSEAKNDEILSEGQEVEQQKHPKAFARFQTILTDFCTELAHLVVRDGEGAEKFVEITVKGAPTYDHAHSIASSISTSALVKCALHGGDANWGRILCAVGYTSLPSSSSWSIDPSRVTVSFLPPPEAASEHSELRVLVNGAPQAVDEDKAGRLLALDDVRILVDLQGGNEGEKAAKEQATYWTCDFSKEYIAINGDYRS